MDWQLIETAPREMDDILVFDERLEVYAVVYWNPLVDDWGPRDHLPHTFKPTHWSRLRPPSAAA